MIVGIVRIARAATSPIVPPHTDGIYQHDSLSSIAATGERFRPHPRLPAETSLNGCCHWARARALLPQPVNASDPNPFRHQSLLNECSYHIVRIARVVPLPIAAHTTDSRTIPCHFRLGDVAITWPSLR